MSALKFLGISGSLRRQSRNSGLLRAARALLPGGVAMDVANLLDVPFYNQDIAEKPASVLRVLQQIEAADALVLACAEYNYSMAPALKNILDWASREPDNRLLARMPVAIMGAGGGMGSSRAQYHLRQSCVFLNMHPLNQPEVFSNAFSESFNEAGDLADERIKGLIQEQMEALKAWALKLKG